MKKKERQTEKRWRLADVGTLLRNSFVAVIKGEFLLRLNIGRYLGQIAWTFFLFTMAILLSFLVDKTLTRVEKNRQLLKELSIERTEKQYELIMLNRRSTVSAILEAQGSAVKEPEKPATVLE